MFFKRNKIGLTLVAGGAKGLAHVGVLKVLEKYEIPIHSIAGCSIGAIVGGAYAYNPDIDAIEKFALNFNKKDWIKTVGKNLFNKQILRDLLSEIIPPDARIEDCDIPFRCNSVDILTGREIVFRKGNLLQAIMASSALPPVFREVRIKDYRLMDGGALNPAPNSLLKELGANKIIMVSIAESPGTKFRGKYSKFNLLHHYSMNATAQLIRLAEQDADVVIRPDVGTIDTLEFWKWQLAIDEGEQATEDLIKSIRRLR